MKQVGPPLEIRIYKVRFLCLMTQSCRLPSTKKVPPLLGTTFELNMKFGLLVVLAVAVVVPSLTEGRIVSRCELKEKLGQAITLPPKLQKFKDEYLAIVICEVNRQSRLNTSLVKVIGKRPTTTTPTTQKTTTQPTTTQPTTPQPTTPQPTTAQPTTPQPTTAQPATAQPISTNATNSTLNRRKRGLSSETGSEETDSADVTSSEKERPNEGVNVTTQRINGPVVEDGDKPKDKKRDEDRAKKGGKRTKRSKEDRSKEDQSKEDQSSEKTKQRPLGLYGIFQLSDETFCNSGYRSSRNKCNTTCDAFIDDDISDDIRCFVKTGQWGSFLKSASRECRYNTKTFFAGC
ncbi:conserved oligomeric Golgi complex subunit 8 isoform X2 [Etheostoma spectabile]|uniref:conserved oligomeric Golgi complex subunit 8 isoform X2 n=1 Tax=Etheostoma spectabile TaxID=54343 RepID=UPI0013AFA0F4|nr:conserved oligomeric Golgi complex subunit 8-like isoform X2 [Etheostoma spectabile]